MSDVSDQLAAIESLLEKVLKRLAELDRKITETRDDVKRVKSRQ